MGLLDLDLGLGFQGLRHPLGDLHREFTGLGIGVQPKVEYRTPLPPDESESFKDRLLHHGASGLSYIGSTLNKPGRAVRGLLAGKWSEGLAAIPFSDSLGITDPENEVRGRDLTNRLGLTDKRDKGWGAWGAGVAADIATDPLTYLSFGAKHALTGGGKALSKVGALKGWSREAMFKGFDVTESGLQAAGHSAPEIAHLIDRGQRIASPAVESEWLRATGRALQPGDPMAGLARVGIPFGPGVTLGHGRIAQGIAHGLDTLGDKLTYGNAVGRTLNQLFNGNVNGAVDEATQRAWAEAGTPALQAQKRLGRAGEYRVLSDLEPLIKGATPQDQEKILRGVRVNLEGSAPSLVDPATLAATKPIGDFIHGQGEHMKEAAQALGLPMRDVADDHIRYGHRMAIKADLRALQTRSANIFPVATSANFHRDQLFRNLPGGTDRINDWVKRFAAHDAADTPGVAGQILDDIVSDYGHLSGGPAPTADQIDAWTKQSRGLAKYFQKADAIYSKEQIPLFTPDEAGTLRHRWDQHARTMAGAEAAYSAMARAAEDPAALAARGITDTVPLSEAMNKLGLVTHPADAVAGTPMFGALPTMYRKLAPRGAGMVDPFLSGTTDALRSEVDRWHLPRDVYGAVVKDYARGQLPEDMVRPVRWLDTATNLFKGLAYPLWPAAHVRNLATAFVNNLRTGTTPLDYIRQYRLMREIGNPAALDVMRGMQYANSNMLLKGHSPITEVTGVDPLVNQMNASLARRLPGTGYTGPTGSFLGDTAYLVGKEGTADLFTGLASKAMHPFNPAVPNPFEMQGVAGGTRDVFAPVAAGRKVSSSIEDFVRGAQFQGLIRQGYAPEMAGEIVDKIHFDYENLARFEKNVMRRAVPFYTFMRKNLPLQLETLATRPGISMAQLYPAMQDRKDKGYVPDYLASEVSVPLGNAPNGYSRYIGGFGLPLEEAFQRLKMKDNRPDWKATAMAYLGTTNPLIKAPLERLFDTQLYSGRRLSDLRPQGTATALGRVFGEDNPQLLAQVMANSPLSRFFTTWDKMVDERKPLWAKLLNTLSGVKITDVDTEKQQAIEMNNALRDMMRGQPHLRESIDYSIRPGMEPMLTPAEMEQMRMKVELQKRSRQYMEQQRRLQAAGLSSTR
jgi:hypothetical protein